MRRLLVIAGVLALVVLNVGLVVAVATQDRDPGLTRDSAPAATAATPTPPAETAGPDGPTDLYVAGDGALLEARRGSCTEAGDARLDVSVDGGETFEEVGLPVQDEALVLRTVLAVDAASVDELVVAGNDAECRTLFFGSDDGGDTWDEQDDFGSWFVTASGSEVRSPEGTTAPGCEPLAVAAVSDQNAKTLCRDGSVRGTNDAGLTWEPFGSLPGASDLAFATFASGYALAPDGDCETRAFETVDAGQTWTPLGCASERSAPGSLALRGAELLARVGQGVRLSDDEGASWRTVGD